MEWSRVKSILIVLLFIVNIFLFIAYANSALKDAHIEKETIQYVTNVLAKRGFSIHPKLISQKGTVLYPAYAVRDIEIEEQIAQNLLGAVQTDRLGSGTVRYQNEQGEIRFRSGGFFESTIFFCEKMENLESMRQFVEEIAKKLDMQIDNQNIYIEEDVQGFRASVTQTITGVPIYNSHLNIWVLPNHSVKITGRMMSGTVTILRGQEPYEISGLLLNLVEELYAQGIKSGIIEQLSSGYRIGSSTASDQSGVIYAVPIWEICVNGRNHYINAMNGKVVFVD